MDDGDHYVDRRSVLKSPALLLGTVLTGCDPGPEASSASIVRLPRAADGMTATSLKGFKPFQPSNRRGPKPNFPRRIGFVAPTITEYMSGLSDACRRACSDRGVEFLYAVSDSDPVKNIDQLWQMVRRGVGGLIIPPLDAAAQSQVAQQAIDLGICVMFLVSSPSTVETMSYQWSFGEAQARAAIDWVQQHITGRGKAAYLNRDQFEALQPRTTAAKAEFAKAKVDLVVNRQDAKGTQAEGFRLASLLLQSHPEINVWVGEDDTILGIDAYLRSIGKVAALNDIALISVGGTTAAKQTLGDDGSFLRAVIASYDNLSSYACGSFCADWLDGKVIPQVLDVSCVPLKSKQDVSRFDAAAADPAGALAKMKAHRFPAIRLWGEVDYATRSNYLRNVIGD